MGSFISARKLAVGVGLSFAFLGGASPGAADVTGSACPPAPQNRQFCVTVTDVDGVSRSPALPGDPFYMQTVVSIESKEASRTLTNVALTATIVDVLADHSTAATTATLASATTDRAGSSCGPLAETGTITCDVGSLSPGDTWSATLVLTTSRTTDAIATRTRARASANERENDSTDPRDPVQEAQEATNDTSYVGGNMGGTFVPPGIARHFSLPTNHSSLEFDSAGTLPFSAFITDHANDPGRCFPGVTCLPQTTEATVGAGASLFGTSNAIRWIRDILNPPTGVKENTITAIHRYDDIAVTVDPATDVFTSTAKSFVSIDGVRFSTDPTEPGAALPAGLQAGKDYFVVNGTASSFQVATTKTGKPVQITSSGTGTTLAQRVRIIGDTKSERAASCAETSSKVPSIHATKLSSVAIRECVSDEENGYMK